MTDLKTTMAVALLGALLSAPLTAAQTRSLTLDAAAATDLRPGALMTAPDVPLANDNRETVAFSWETNDAPATLEQPEPFTAHSREFQRTVTAAALARGVTVTTDGAGAVIRLSSAAPGVLLDPDRLTLEFGDGRRVSAAAASDQLVSSDDLRAAGMAAPSAALGLRLAPAFGGGDVVLRYDAALPDNAPVTVWVLDRNSDTVLSARSAAGQFMSVADARARVELLSAATGHGAFTVNGTAVAPDGTSHALRIGRDGQARFASPQSVQWQPGLWEWRFHAKTRSGIERIARTAFAMSVPVARFDDSVLVQFDRGELRVALGAEVKTAGRYEARATLLATDASGKRVPAMVGAVAGWLEPGGGVLTMRFDAGALKSRGLRAPYELQHLSLADQSRMGLLELRARALTF